MNRNSGSVTFGSIEESGIFSLLKDRPVVLITAQEVGQIGDVEAKLNGFIPHLETIQVPDGEKQKSLPVAEEILNRLSEAKFSRDGLVIGLGGGATTDLAGFIASIWMRGVDWIAIPTTLAAMVDAAIGGKTGINLDSGKNLVGSFHQPLHTFIDIGFLRTLSRRDFAAGLAEVIKCGMIRDPAIIEIAESTSLDQLMMEEHSRKLFELIERSVAVKQAVVSSDFKEQGERAFLNYGHTLAHAIEVTHNFSLRHGEAVAIGMTFAAELSRRAIGLDKGIVERQRNLISRYELPASLDLGSFEQIFEIMKRDKKSSQGKMRFVLLRELGNPEINDAITTEMLESVFRDLFVEV